MSWFISSRFDIVNYLDIKEWSLSHKLFSKTFATKGCRPYIFQTMNSVRSKDQMFKFEISKVYTIRLERFMY